MDWEQTLEPKTPEMTYFLAFTLPGLPKPVNAQNSMHWAKKGAEVKGWHLAVKCAVGVRKPAKPLTQAKLVLIRRSSTCPDYDGLVSSFKAITDGLVACGVLQDDNMNVIGVPKFQWERAAQKQGSISVVVISSS